MKCMYILLVFLQVDASFQQNILPEHKRRHCSALQTNDIMEHALPEIRRILQAESESSRRQHGELLSSLRGAIMLRCEPGWVYHDDNCYLFSQTAMTWGETIVACQNRNAYLADIRSDQENRFIKSELMTLEKETSDAGYYVGGYLNRMKRKWIWNRTEEQLFYNDWKPNEPNDQGSNEGCIMMWKLHSFQWNDVPCNIRFKMICKKSVEHKVYP